MSYLRLLLSKKCKEGNVFLKRDWRWNERKNKKEVVEIFEYD